MDDNLLSNDLDFILSRTVSMWNELKGKRIFITGGTGFLGTWILESFVWANSKLKLNAEAVVLTRNPTNFLNKYPHLANNKALKFYEGDIKNFTFPQGNFSHVIHAATESSYSKISPWEMWETIIYGTKYILEFAKNCRAKKFLLISSGAMYGKQFGHEIINERKLSQFETSGLIPTYSIGKFFAEYMSNLYAREQGFTCMIARCFAFFGPYLPLDLHFAIGNFIKNRLQNQAILIRGNAKAIRSYLYISDLCIWLWTILFRGRHLNAYNVGSNEKYSIMEIANIIATSKNPKVEIKIINAHKQSIAGDHLVPDISLVKKHLNLEPQINFSNALNKTMSWFYRNSYLYE